MAVFIVFGFSRSTTAATFRDGTSLPGPVAVNVVKHLGDPNPAALISQMQISEILLDD